MTESGVVGVIAIRPIRCLVYQASIHMQFQGWIEGWVKLISLFKFRFMDGPGLNEVINDPTQYHGIMLIQ